MTNPMRHPNSRAAFLSLSRVAGERLDSQIVLATLRRGSLYPIRYNDDIPSPIPHIFPASAGLARIVGSAIRTPHPDNLNP